MQSTPITKVFWIFSPTYLLADWRKKQAKGKSDRAQKIIKYNMSYFSLSIWFLVAIELIGKSNGEIAKNFVWINNLTIFLFVWVIPFSRCNEIFWAFIQDALEKVEQTTSKSNLTYRQRLNLAFFSYGELVINFALMFYVMPETWWGTNKFATTIDALYFSGITIVTVGYGDYTPTYWIPKLLTVYEVFCGVVLLVVSFTVYTSRGLSENTKSNQAASKRNNTQRD